VHIPTQTVINLLFIFGLLVVPRAMQRFRIPAQLTCFIFGIAASIFFKTIIDSHVLSAVSTLGIASLFLFAGLEVDMPEITRQLPRLLNHLGTRGLFLWGFIWVSMRYLHFAWQPASLLALALLTPSTGFILDTLHASGLDSSEQSEVTIRAVAGEILALLVLFVVSQDSGKSFALSSAALLLLIVLTPFFYIALAKYVLPFAQGSEFSLLIMVGVICAIITKTIGVHVLLGAFIAGLVAGLLKHRLPTVVSTENLRAVRLFSTFFVPFYFFHEGLDVPTGALVFKALLYGLAISFVVLPLRIAKNCLVCHYFCRRTRQGGLRVAIALTPTLIFTLVIAGILRESFQISDALYGGLLVYAATSTILPSFVLPGLAERTINAVVAEAEA
jgi:Kef-type K+ transport system membrane component KefB